MAAERVVRLLPPLIIDDPAADAVPRDKREVDRVDRRPRAGRRRVVQHSADRQALAGFINLAAHTGKKSDKGGITLHADMPGVSKERLEIQVEGDTLSIDGDATIDEAVDRGKEGRRGARVDGEISMAKNLGRAVAKPDVLGSGVVPIVAIVVPPSGPPTTLRSSGTWKRLFVAAGPMRSSSSASRAGNAFLRKCSA